ncbi:MAG: type II secretion system protein [Phycisphaerales bacterium]
MQKTSRGFSLVEILVAIGIIAVLISILVPAVAGARSAARETVALANQRSVGQLFETYSATYRAYPYRSRGVPPPGREQIPARPGVLFVEWWPEVSIIGTTDHFQQEWLWPGITLTLASWPENYKTWVSPGLPSEPPEDPDGRGEIQDAISVRYSNSFVARPQLFTPGAQAADALLGAVEPGDVLFPAGKVMLFDAHIAYLPKEPARIGDHYDALTPMCFADLHAEKHNPTQATPGVANVMRGGMNKTLHCTPEGVRGRDY